MPFAWLLQGGLFAGCEKETVIEADRQELINSKQLADNIINFRNNILQPDTKKTGETFTLDSAINIMEAAFNYHHGKYNRDYSELLYDSVIIPTQYSEKSLINADTLQALYKNINNQLYTIYEDCSFSNKRIKFVDIYFTTNNQKNYIKTLLAIGNESSQKASSDPIEFPVVTSDDLWAGATPFNNQQGENWQLADGHNNICYANSNVYQFFTDTEVASAINNAISLPYDGSNVYIYLINTEYIRNIYMGLYANIYEYSPHIAQPYERDIQDPNFLFQHYGYLESNTAIWKYSKALKNNKSNYLTTPKTTYRFMNKYYNICVAAVEYFKPNNYHKKAIDLTFGTLIYDVWTSFTTAERNLSAGIRISYAQDQPNPYHDLYKLTYIE